MKDCLRRELRAFYEAEGQEDYQSRLYDDRDWIHKRLQALVSAELRAHCVPTTRLLDAGCAEGLYLRLARDIGAVSMGVDLSFAKLVRGHSSPATSDGIGFCQATLEALPWGQDQFDTVLCIETLEHVPDYRGALSELCRVLKPSGTLIVSVPTEKSELGGSYKAKLDWRQKSGHIHSFSRKDFARALSDVGLMVDKEVTVDVLGAKLRYALVSNVLWKSARAIRRSWHRPRQTETRSETSELQGFSPSVTAGFWLRMDTVLTRIPLVRHWSSMAVWVGHKTN